MRGVGKENNRDCVMVKGKAVGGGAHTHQIALL